jgi:hypothetical protein
MINNVFDTTCHTLVLKEANQSFHTCVQDVQVTRTANSKVIHNVMITASQSISLTK